MAVDLTEINKINQWAKVNIKSPVATVTPAPKYTPMSTPAPRQSVVPMATPAPRATPAPVPAQPSAFQKITTPIKNLAQAGMRALQVPSEVTEKGITGVFGKTNYEDVYRKNKVPEVAVKPLAFGARMLLDPLNLVPYLKGGKILSSLGKATGITEKVAPLMSKAKNFINPALNLPEDLQYAQKMIPRRAAARTESYVAKMTPIVEGMTTQARTAAAKLLQGTKDAKKDFELLDSVQRAKVSKYFAAANQQRIDELTRARDLGLVTEKKFKEMMKNVSKYYHATDFEKYTTKPNILQKFRQGIATTTGYFKKKTGAEGFSMDAPLAMAKREMKQLFDEEKAKVLIGLKKNPEYSVKVGRGPAPEGFVKVAGDMLSGHRMLKGYAVKQNIYDAMIKTNEIARGPVGQALNKFNSVWKPIVTAYNPAFHAQNALGNLYQMALGGVRNPKRFIQAIAGNIPEAERTTAKAGGVLNSGQVMESLSNSMGDVSKLADKGILRKIWDKTGGKLGEMGNAVENNARTAMYNDAYQKAIKSGKTAAQAAQEAFTHTNKYLFDYATGLGSREKAIRDVLPFYSWSRFNIPLQASELAKQPAFFAAQGKLSRTVEPDKKGIPDERGYSLPTPWKGPDGGNIRYSPNLPSNSLFDASKPTEMAANMVSPLLKDALTIGSNLAGADTGQYTFGGFKGKPIIPPGYSAEGKARSIADWLQSRFRPFKDIQNSANIGGVPGILKYLLGGFNNVNEQKNKLNEIFAQQEKNNIKNKELRSAVQRGNKGYINRLRSQR